MRLVGLIACSLAVASAAPAAPPEGAVAAAMARTYFSLLGQRRYRAALRLRNDDMPPASFVRAFRPYRSYHGSVGRPGQVEGAAGSLYVELPVRVSGRLRSGRPFSQRGTVTLRRVGDVPGATASQRRWHIYRTDVRPPLRP
jgi:hypothetical protein